MTEPVGRAAPMAVAHVRKIVERLWKGELCDVAG